jgi:hypothetical protein
VTRSGAYWIWWATPTRRSWWLAKVSRRSDDTSGEGKGDTEMTKLMFMLGVFGPMIYGLMYFLAAAGL